MRHASWVGVLVVMAAGTVEAAEVGSPNSRVRAAGAEAHELLVRAAEQSPTVAALVDAIEASDIVVVVELKPLVKGMNGRVQVAATTPTVRYLRLTLGVPNGKAELAALLGHELRHVVEIAGLPEVRDDASLAAVFRKIGWAVRGDGFFETEAALEAGRAVARELKAVR